MSLAILYLLMIKAYKISYKYRNEDNDDNDDNNSSNTNYTNITNN